MARYSYDVDTTRKYIDVHKQFNGGLKTVDTDDALGAVFLREAENVSLSEFGFIEKRYGTYEKAAQAFSGNLQGYWEFLGRKIYAIDGVFYVDGTAVTEFEKENLDYRYPSEEALPLTGDPIYTCSFVPTGVVQTFEIKPETNPTCGEDVEKWECTAIEFDPENNFQPTLWSCSQSIGVLEVSGYIVAPLQTTREMSGIVKNDVLYIFTGTYPIYVKEVDAALKFFLMPIEKPSYDEIVIVGHNLLEENYEEVYGFSGDLYQLKSSDNENTYNPVGENEVDMESKETSFYPRLPFVSNDGVEGVINFDVAYKYNSVINSEPATIKIKIDEFAYAVSGSGVSTFDFTPVNPEFYTHTPLNNVPNGTTVVTNNDDAKTIDTSSARFYDPNYPKIPDFENEIVYTKEVKQIFDASIPRDSLYNINHTFIHLPVDYLQENTTYQFAVFSKPDTSINNTRLHFQDEILDQNDLYLRSFTDDYPSGSTPVGTWDNRFFGVALYPIYGSSAVNAQQTKNERVELSHLADFGSIEIDDGYFKFTPSTSHLNSVKQNRPIGVLVHIKSPYLAYSDGSEITEEPMYESYISSSWADYTSESFQMTNINNNYRSSVLGSGLLYTLDTITGSADTKFGNRLSVELRNLISGTFDFKIRFALVELDTGILLQPPEVLKTFEVYIRNVSITSEKLQDYYDETLRPEFLPKLKPVWSCNQVIEHFGKLMVWGSLDMKNSVFYSFPDRPGYFPSKFYLDFGSDSEDPVVSVSPYMNILVVQTPNQTWGVRGNSGYLDSPAPYTPFTINSTVGTIAPKSVRPIRNHLFFLSKQGIIALKSLYAADEQYNIEFADLNIRNIVPQDSDAVGIQYDNQYWLNFPNYGITLRWYIDKRAWVKDTYGAWSDFNGVFKYQIINGKLEFITYPSVYDAENLTIYKIGVNKGLPSDLGGVITSKFQTSFLNQNYPFHPKKYKEMKLDFTLQNEYLVTQSAIPVTGVDDGTPLSYTAALKANHIYQIAFNYPLTTKAQAALVEGVDYTYEDEKPVTVSNLSVTVGGQSATAAVVRDSIEFTMPPYLEDGTYDIVLSFTLDPVQTDFEFAMYDVTYDNQISFKSAALSERDTLISQTYDTYTPTVEVLDTNLNAAFGQIDFGNSFFGNLVTAVETIKLTGSGYNSKLYFEDAGKLKWTLESLGITYKMRKARSRI